MYASTLEKKISKYLKQFGIKRAYCDKQFFYDPYKETVNFTILQYTTDEELIAFIDETYETNIRPWYFIFCLLHEVGHHMTVDQLTEEDFAFEVAMRNQILGMLDPEKHNDIYFRLPAEDLANRWAINYIANHERECWEFQRKCFAVMAHIFKKKSFTY